MRAYVGGTTTAAPAEPAAGITVVDLDAGTIMPVGATAPNARNPTYLTMSADQQLLYAAHATTDGQVSAWRIAGDQLVEHGPAQPSAAGTLCHLSLHPGGKFLLVASYRSGTIAAHPIRADGAVGEASHVVQHAGSGPHSVRQAGPHTHMIITDPESGPGRGHVLAVDLGTDTIYRYHLDESAGKLILRDHIRLPPGTGPRHLAVHGQYAYVAGELASTLSVIDLDTSPPTVRSTVPTRPHGGPEPSFPSAIRLSADGKFCYVANRGPNTLAVFAVDGPEVSLTSTADTTVDYPWDIAVDGEYLYVVGQRSNSLRALRADPATGAMRTVGEPYHVPSPVCILPVSV